MKRFGLLVLSAILLLTACNGAEIPNEIESTVSQSVTEGEQSPTDEYGFASDRFGAEGEKFVAEETEMGQYPYPEELMNATNDEIRIQRAMAKKLMQDIRYARANGIDTVYVEPGYYRFNDSLAFALVGAENLTIVGGPDVHFLQEGSQHVIHLQDCKNVTIKGVTCDFTYLSFVQATVTGIDANKNPIVSIDENYRETYDRLASLLHGNRMIFFDGTDLTREKVNTTATGFLDQMVDNGDGTYTVTYLTENVLTFQPDLGVVAGDKMVFFYRSAPHAIRLGNCESVTLEDVDVYGAPGFGIAEEANTLTDAHVGHNVFRRVRIIRRPGTDRLVATSADGFHSTNVRNGALLEKCEISYTEDDALNYHTFKGFVTKIISDTEFEITFPLTTLLDVNTDLIFYRKGRATIADLTIVTDHAVLEEARKTDEKIKAALGTTVRTFDNPAVYIVKLNETPDREPALYDTVSTIGFSGAGLTIKDCYIHDTHGRGLFITGPDATVDNCTFYRVAGVSIELQREDMWAEGPYPSGITVENCLFLNNGCTINAQAQPGVIVASSNAASMVTDIVVRNNEFVGNHVGAFYAHLVTGVVFSGNTVKDYATEKPTELGMKYATAGGVIDGFYGLIISHCNTVEVKDNSFSGRGQYAIDDLYIAFSANVSQ